MQSSFEKDKKTQMDIENPSAVQDCNTQRENQLVFGLTNLNLDDMTAYSKKFLTFQSIAQKLDSLEWTSGEPMNQLTPQTYWWLINTLYFTWDEEILNRLARQRMDIKYEEKESYDFETDLKVLQMRRLAKSISTGEGEVELDEMINALRYKQIWNISNDLKCQKSSIQNVMDNILAESPPAKKIKLLDIPNTEGLLKNFCGLTEEEHDFLNYKERQQQELSAQMELCQKTQGGKQQRKNLLRVSHEVLDDIRCQVCNDGDYQDDNLIVFCAKCNIAVHQKCYLIYEIPQDDWICDVCAKFGINGQYLRCALCPKLGGALKKTNISTETELFIHNNPSYHAATHKQAKVAEIDPNFQYNIFDCQLKDITYEENAQLEPKPTEVWVHMTCLFWVPECYIDPKTQVLKGIDNVDKKRFLLDCASCGLKKCGASIQCSNGQCYQAFHPECARRSNKLISITLGLNNNIEYNLYCDKHTPFRLKRILEAKYRSYEKEISEFFKSYERMRIHINRIIRQKRDQLMVEKKLKKTQREQNQGKNKTRHHFSEGDLQAFSTQFRSYLEQQKIVVSFESNSVTSIQFPDLTKEYPLRIVPNFILAKATQYQADILPFYKGNIPEEDIIWDKFTFNNYKRSKLFALYQKAVHKASRFMLELNPSKAKKQQKLLELLTRKEQKNTENEERKEIIETVIDNEIFYQDENLYCVCRRKFVDGDPMIQCEMCDEWFHFECLYVKSNIIHLDHLEFYCFLCEDDLDPAKRRKVLASYRRHFEDPTFFLSRQLAEKCNLAYKREQNLKLKKAKEMQQEAEPPAVDIPSQSNSAERLQADTTVVQQTILVDFNTSQENASEKPNLVEELIEEPQINNKHIVEEPSLF